MARGGRRGATGAAARIKYRSVPRGSPWIEPVTRRGNRLNVLNGSGRWINNLRGAVSCRQVICQQVQSVTSERSPGPVGCGACCSRTVHRSVFWVVERRIHAATTAIFSVGICTALASAVTLLAADGAADRHPQARLCGVTRVCAVSAGAGEVPVDLRSVVCSRVGMLPTSAWIPNVGSLSATPLRELTVNSIAGLGRDEHIMGCRRGEEKAHEVGRLQHDCKVFFAGRPGV